MGQPFGIVPPLKKVEPNKNPPLKKVEPNKNPPLKKEEPNLKLF